MWQQVDAPQMVRDVLRRHVPDPETVSATVPDKWTPSKGPHITVVSDGTPVSTRSWTREQVRVTVRAHDGHTARKIMTQIDALLLTPLAAGLMASIQAGAGIIAGPDSKLGGWVSSATYSVASHKMKGR